MSKPGVETKPLAQTAAPAAPRGSHNPMVQKRLDFRPTSSAASSTTAGFAPNGIYYSGGPLMLEPVSVYYIWYGNWTTHATSEQQLKSLIGDLSGSNYHRITQTYYDLLGNRPSLAISLKGDMAEAVIAPPGKSGPAPYGTNLSALNVEDIVQDALNAGRIPSDENAIVFVMGGTDITGTLPDGTSYCAQWCAYHSDMTDLNTINHIKYAFVAGPDQCKNTSGCNQFYDDSTGKTSATPNGDLVADVMASEVVHELEEAVSDPRPSIPAWQNGGAFPENEDICRPYFRWPTASHIATGQANAGAPYDVTLGAHKYYIQPNWINMNGGSCTMGRSISTAVGVFADTDLCAGKTSVDINMTDESNLNQNSHNGWNGAATNTGGKTHFKFCKVTTTKLKPLVINGAIQPYAVLKLGDVCPAGSGEFTAFEDNEITSNANSVKGEIFPNASLTALGSQGSGTRYHFCLFTGGSSTMTSFPDLGVGHYGVLGDSIPGKTQGFLGIDDEDDSFRDDETCVDASVCDQPLDLYWDSSGDTYVSLVKAR